MEAEHIAFSGHLVVPGSSAAPADMQRMAGLVLRFGVRRGIGHVAFQYLPIEDERQSDGVEHRRAIHDLKMQMRRGA